jgi:hypothetical protein
MSWALNYKNDLKKWLFSDFTDMTDWPNKVDTENTPNDPQPKRLKFL